MSILGKVIVEAHDGDGKFGRVQAVEFNPERAQNKRGADGRVEYSRQGAIDWAQKEVSRWDASHQFNNGNVRYRVVDPQR